MLIFGGGEHPGSHSGAGPDVRADFHSRRGSRRTDPWTACGMRQSEEVRERTRHRQPARRRRPLNISQPEAAASSAVKAPVSSVRTRATWSSGSCRQGAFAGVSDQERLGGSHDIPGLCDCAARGMESEFTGIVEKWPNRWATDTAASCNHQLVAAIRPSGRTILARHRTSCQSARADRYFAAPTRGRSFDSAAPS